MRLRDRFFPQPDAIVVGRIETEPSCYRKPPRCLERSSRRAPIQTFEGGCLLLCISVILDTHELERAAPTSPPRSRRFCFTRQAYGPSRAVLESGNRREEGRSALVTIPGRRALQLPALLARRRCNAC